MNWEINFPSSDMSGGVLTAVIYNISSPLGWSRLISRSLDGGAMWSVLIERHYHIMKIALFVNRSTDFPTHCAVWRLGCFFDCSYTRQEAPFVLGSVYNHSLPCRHLTPTSVLWFNLLIRNWPGDKSQSDMEMRYGWDTGLEQTSGLCKRLNSIAVQWIYIHSTG